MSFYRFSLTKRKIRAYIRRKQRLGVVVTADEIWNKIKSFPKLEDEEREVIFQQTKDLKFRRS